MTRYDLHQHLWTEPLVAALARRTDAPRIRRDGLLWRLDLPGEPSCTVDVEGDNPERRAGLVCLDGLDRALIAPSLALGLEWLPDLGEAYAEGCADLPEAFGAWGVLNLRDPSPDAVDDLLEAGFAGVCVSSGAVASPARLERLGPVLERLEHHDAPLFVHPGLGGRSDVEGLDGDLPSWWPALTSYVTGMHLAWHAWIAAGRAAHPRLRILWAMLAGGAPLHGERLAARGGPAAAVLDPGSFYDTSSYGPTMLEATARVVGLDRLAHGSDRPLVAPMPAPGALGPAAWESMTLHAPARLLGTRAAATTASVMTARSASAVT